MRSIGAVLPLACVLLVASGCASDGDNDETPQSAEADEAALRVLDEWSDVVTTALVTVRDQSEAYRAGRARQGARLERRARRLLDPVQHYGRDARNAMFDYRGRVARKLIAAGDGWAEWAHTLLTAPPRGDFDKARRIADLGLVAVRRHRAAYHATGREPPAAFRVR
jgi:hypothetical protein